MNKATKVDAVLVIGYAVFGLFNLIVSVVAAWVDDYHRATYTLAWAVIFFWLLDQKTGSSNG